MSATLINLYHQAEDYFFRGISSKCLDLDGGANAYMTGGAEINLIYITRNTNGLDKILIKGKQLMGLIVLGPMARTPWWSSNEFWQSHGYFACADALAFGCLAALTAQHWRFTQRQAKIILVRRLI